MTETSNRITFRTLKVDKNTRPKKKTITVFKRNKKLISMAQKVLNEEKPYRLIALV